MEAFDRQLECYRGKIFVSELGCGGMSDLEETVAQYQDQEHLVDACEMKTFRDSLQLLVDGRVGLPGLEAGMKKLEGAIADLSASHA